MKQEERDLLIKDLCARLPYGVKGINQYGKIIELDHPTDYSPYMSIKNAVLKYGWRPYLFPLSNMTKEQENEWDNLHFNPLDVILEGKFNGEGERLQLISKSMVDPIQWCYKNHFDCNDLISLGLAIDCTNLNIY